MTHALIGKPLDRVDGPAKVQGTATYAAEHKPEHLAYGVIVGSTVAAGRIARLYTQQAEAAPGVLAVLTPDNTDALADVEPDFAAGLKAGEKRAPLKGDQVFYDGQAIAVVVADTLERAQDAARLVRATYDTVAPVVTIEQAEQAAPPMQPEQFFGEGLQANRGDAEAALAAAPVTVEATYTTPIEHHNPLEPHAVIAEWHADALTLYDTTQWVYGSRNVLAKRLGIAPEQIHVVSPFVGGGFGCKGFPWGHSALAAVAARRVGRPVKIALSRRQMFTSNGHRARTVQRLALGADDSGRLAALRHVTTTQTSQVDEFIEPAGLTSRLLYACPNVAVVHRLVRVNTGTPTPMRAPGESPGMFALESVLDELSDKLGMDPIELRRVNHAQINQQSDKPFSSKHLMECYEIGAGLIGWNRRAPRPGATRDGRYLVGYGMATATYPANRFPCAARIAVFADGGAAVYSATHDIGTGTYTIMTQITAELLGLPPDRVKAVIGDSLLPQAPVSGGSTTAASLSAAIVAAAEALRGGMLKVLAGAGGEASPFAGLGADEVGFADGALVAAADPARRLPFAEIVRRSGQGRVEATAFANLAGVDAAQREANPAAKASAGDTPPLGGEEPFAFQSFGAQFAEVRVDPDLGEVRVTRFASVHDVGTILNEKTATSQVYSGVIQGIGMALMEETALDPRTGRIMTRNLADYHVPVSLDVPEIAVRFVGIPDRHLNALGVRGVGEIGITGVAAAVANAVYNATGVRVRDLPLTPDKLLAARLPAAAE